MQDWSGWLTNTMNMELSGKVRTSLEVQRLRLPIQGAQVWSLVGEDPKCCKVKNKPKKLAKSDAGQALSPTHLGCFHEQPTWMWFRQVLVWGGKLELGTRSFRESSCIQLSGLHTLKQPGVKYRASFVQKIKQKGSEEDRREGLLAQGREAS